MCEQVSFNCTPNSVWQRQGRSSPFAQQSTLHASTACLVQRVRAILNEGLDVRSTALSGELGAVAAHWHTLLVDNKLSAHPRRTLVRALPSETCWLISSLIQDRLPTALGRNNPKDCNIEWGLMRTFSKFQVMSERRMGVQRIGWPLLLSEMWSAPAPPLSSAACEPTTS